ncbi:MAG TPA: carbon monoxide dehydrogenase subunit G [Jatrophihabitans sp.]|nr:carbon monoxide dehydrogenase subunit G [Jatrophihabitans sp.]
MKVAGEAVLHAPLDRVWTALRDPAVLVTTIPGCERLVATGPDSYDMTVTAGVASIKGSYAGTVSLTDLPEPNTFLMKASGAGGPGTVSADVTVTLVEADDATRLRYDADAVVGGVIGGVGQRMLAGVAKKLAGEFFAAVDEVLTGARAVQPATVAPADEAGTSSMPMVYRDAVPGRVAARPGEPVSFILGAVFGAATALLGVLVGARTARTSRNTRTARRMG